MSAYIEDLTRSHHRGSQAGTELSNGYGAPPPMNTPVSGAGQFGTPSTLVAPHWPNEISQPDMPTSIKSTSSFIMSPDTTRNPLDPLTMSAPLAEILRHAERSRLESEAPGRTSGQRQQSAMRSTGLTPGKDIGASPNNAEDSSSSLEKDPIELGWCSEDQGRKMFE